MQLQEGCAVSSIFILQGGSIQTSLLSIQTDRYENFNLLQSSYSNGCFVCPRFGLSPEMLGLTHPYKRQGCLSPFLFFAGKKLLSAKLSSAKNHNN